MEAYQIGVKIGLSNGMSPVLAIISKELLGINSTVKQIEGNIKKWGLAVGGAGAALAGGAVIRGLSKIADHGKEILHQQEQMRVAGMQNKEVVEATAKAWETSRQIQVTTAAENLKHLRELRYATGDTEGAMAILNPVTKANAILNAVKGGAGGTDQVFELVKALEQKGLATSEKRGEFLSYVDAMTKAVVASGGRVTPQMFQSAFKYGRTAMLGWDEEFITQILPRSIQSMATGRGGGGGSGSGGPGNALMTGFRQMVSGVMSKPAAALMQELGFGHAAHQKGTTKSYTAVNPDLVKTMIHNPYEAIQSMMPAITKMAHNNQEEIIKLMGILFPVRTWGSVATEYGLQGRYMMGHASPFEKDRKLWHAGMGLGGYEEEAGKDPNTIYKAYEQQKENALDAVGVPLQPAKLAVIKALTQMFMSMAQFASVNPGAIQEIGKALLTLGAAMVTAGVVAIALTLGPIGAAIIALGVAIAGFTLKTDAFKPAWDSLQKNFPALAQYLRELGKAAEIILTPIRALAAAVRFLGSVISHMPSMGAGTGANSAIPGGEGMPSFQRENYMPPAGGGGSRPIHVNLQVDGTKLGSVVLRDFNRRASLPIEGSPFHDRTWQATPLDTALG